MKTFTRLQITACALALTASTALADSEFFSRPHISRHHLAVAYAIAEMEEHETDGQSCHVPALELERIKDNVRRKANALGYSMSDIRAQAQAIEATGGLPGDGGILPTCAVVWNLTDRP